MTTEQKVKDLRQAAEDLEWMVGFADVTYETEAKRIAVSLRAVADELEAA